MTEKLYKNRDWMFEQYELKHKSLESIAFECDCSKMTVYRYLLKFKIPVRDRIEAVKERFK